MALREYEEAQFWEFVTARRRGLVRVAFLLTGDHGLAEDFVQDALFQAYRHWRRIERREQPEAYVRKIVVNLANSRWRRLKDRNVSLYSSVPDRPTTRDAHADVDRSDEVWRALATLPTGMRTVIVLRFYEELSEAETAAVLGKSVGTVKSQSSRGLARLREVLGAPAQGKQTDPAYVAGRLGNTHV
ncbi:RNA polymerase, sigma-24 subunit, ECF subfamily [Catenulispora acidiphila DSM 44928]|uniref:RNA polymerase, sigma-24 subunit, ECF subfamily n=1 Tax=Catenulispora acidiphila (strain DSM 44928 / JCM 14897 / NBRC 102108 / NRRL B-24433 / ID139908) TaxID=479433 RepID=C7PYB0_CATAD|nr:SigE family RNA polymerase sigma factor [Catenulispora acidiphila]ACU75400.1 RNA polymerase, sigma-24 subunit, ECF subfamily [Catenulispora acidiphila DSM 44928]